MSITGSPVPSHSQLAKRAAHYDLNRALLKIIDAHGAGKARGIVLIALEKLLASDR